QLAYMSMLKRGVKDISKIRPINGFLITPGFDKQGTSHDFQILEGVTSISKTALRIQGGGLCEGFSKETAGALPGFTFYNGKIHQGAVVSVILGSELEIGYGAETGIKPIANIGLITKIRNPWIIEEINGKPATEVMLKVYKEHTKINTERLIKTPDWLTPILSGYATAIPESTGNFCWPIIQGIEKEHLRCATPVKEGITLVLGQITKESCKQATSKATQLMIKDIDSKNFGFVLFFSCAVRGMILGKDYMAEIKKIKETLGNKDIPVFGIASAGEQAFYKTGSPIGTALTITMMGISNESIFISKEAR
ncbi:FIST C-terminal domain-containing protein, partial [Candidatus Parcubacteria bacterium]|nr:FIST C-terminal domain-containing protein [Candidatus Parcubacteria bacterium]